MGLCSPWDDTKIEEPGMIDLNPVNILMTTSEFTKPAP